MRQRADYERDVAEGRVVGGDERHVATGDPHGGAALFVGGGECERQIWMALDESAELAAGVAAGPEDADWYLIHE